MHPAKIIGRVVATVKYPTTKGVKLLLIQPTDWEGAQSYDYHVAADAVGAGDEEFIFYVESMEAAMVFDTRPPIDCSVVGIIDGVQLDYDLYNGGRSKPEESPPVEVKSEIKEQRLDNEEKDLKVASREAEV